MGYSVYPTGEGTLLSVQRIVPNPNNITVALPAGYTEYRLELRNFGSTVAGVNQRIRFCSGGALTPITSVNYQQITNRFVSNPVLGQTGSGAGAAFIDFIEFQLDEINGAANPFKRASATFWLRHMHPVSLADSNPQVIVRGIGHNAAGGLVQYESVGELNLRTNDITGVRIYPVADGLRQADVYLYGY